MKPDLRKTFDWLKAQGLPPLPIAPAQHPQQYPARERDGTLKRDSNGALIPAFTGKNPSFLDANGIPHLIRHTQYQHQLPTEQEFRTWFTHPANGIGTLGGWQNLVWLDVDVKQFGSQEACNARISHWLSQHPRLQQTFTERTHSGGWRFAVRVPEKRFTNFSLDGLGGQHMGEALGQGRFTVLAPTIGPSGQSYVNLQRVSPVWVERLEAIGVYPVSRRRGQSEPTHLRPPIQVHPAQPGVLRLEDLATAKAQAVLQGESPLESRSHSLTYALREFYGWENWATEHGVPINGDAEALAKEAGAALGIDVERVERIIQSIVDPEKCIPAAVFAGGDESAWKRVQALSHLKYPSYSSIGQTNQAELSAGGYLKGGELQNVVRDLHYILRQSPTIQTAKHHTDRDDWSPRKRLLHGHTYTFESEGQHLIVRAASRGLIFQARGFVVELSKVTHLDKQRFMVEAKRLQQTHSLSPIRPSGCEALER
ncbi:hypothetical protein XM38_013220 [Halomicronema hongdechloris C2206]|uniref:DNA primase/polymerase bifunctional N-terminal domain-containing protein n=1 Tax=Halomicronema hongdechloris C2206 TaxID=1641165 RepID=A0A1Z3HJ90_9CYAN|nr:bifunctional DNA primase/polymerase [Halomicronema hongdechloris]ASC70384.1 hypothetical protein XM38_013220 [Halomicronema hongdechloris C2206]